MTVDYGEPVLLTTVEQVLDADMLLAMLQDNDIPAFIKSRGIGGYMIIAMNVAYTGIEIYVPQTLLEQAQELVAAFFSADYAEDEEYTDEQ